MYIERHTESELAVTFLLEVTSWPSGALMAVDAFIALRTNLGYKHEDKKHRIF